jgi:hypothetical protein
VKSYKSPGDILIRGATLMLLGGLLLLYGYGMATPGTSQLQGVAYWTTISETMFFRSAESLFGWSFLALFLLGACLVVCGLARLGRR